MAKNMEIEISVIIPTYNRKELLEKTLIALTRQTLNKNKFEVIVVDDGGQDGSQEICEHYHHVLNLRYYWQYDKGFRAGKARNIGISAAEGRYILFIDTGVLLQQNALQLHLNVHRQSKIPSVCIGYVYGFEVPENMIGTIEHSIDAEDVSSTAALLKEINAVDIRQQQYDEFGYNIASWPAPFDIFWTCHVSAEKKEIVKAGLFDEQFNSWGGEDVDLGVRLFLQNNRFLINRSIYSVHIPHKKEVNDHKNEAELAGKKIHEKYNLWQTSFYGCDLGESKFSLNKVIHKYADQSHGENDAFIRKYLYHA